MCVCTCMHVCIYIYNPFWSAGAQRPRRHPVEALYLHRHRFHISYTYMYIYMYIYIHVCMCVCTCMHVCIHIYNPFWSAGAQRSSRHSVEAPRHHPTRGEHCRIAPAFFGHVGAL